ncbi:TonB-dependent receptor plug domain-containing protein [Geopseudomonas aromaticivorans]
MLLAATLPFLASLPATPVHGDDLLGEFAPLPEILTATRLRQAPAAVPGSMSVIDRRLIKASGARTLPELLRLVPGMLVVPEGNVTTVNYHGSSAGQARRMQVLVDGRSVYRPGFAQVDWADIPVAMEDIERIEVFRGPNTVSYGANALMAVVNILTRTPRDSHGTRMTVTQGERGISDWYARHGTSWSTGDMRLSMSGFEDDGFDYKAPGVDHRDSRRLTRLNLRATHNLDASQSLDWQIALKEGSNQIDNHYQATLPIAAQPWEEDGDSDVRANDFAASLRWDKQLSSDHSLYVQTNLQQWERLRDWRACDAAVTFSPQLGQLWSSSPAYVGQFNTAVGKLLRGQPFALPAGTPEQQALAMTVLQQMAQSYDPATRSFAHTCGLINEDLRERRFDLEVQDTLSLTDDLRLVSGLSYRHDMTDSPTHLHGSEEKDIGRLFSQAEWYIDEHWLLQGGAMFEYDSSAGSSLSPRAAINYLFTPAHGLRAVYSEAVRSPDMFENDADWSYSVRDLRPTVAGQSEALFFMTAQGTGDLNQEHIRSREVGYNGNFQQIGLTVDIKAFYDEIDNLISHTPKIYAFTPSNDNKLRLKGTEIEMDWQISLTDRLRMQYANIDADATHPLDQIATPTNSGSAGWMRDWGYGWNSSLFYYGADSLNGYRFERADIRLAKTIKVAGAEVELAGVLQQRLDDEPIGFAINNYDDRRVTWLTGEISF